MYNTCGAGTGSVFGYLLLERLSVDNGKKWSRTTQSCAWPSFAGAHGRHNHVGRNLGLVSRFASGTFIRRLREKLSRTAVLCVHPVA